MSRLAPSVSLALCAIFLLSAIRALPLPADQDEPVHIALRLPRNDESYARSIADDHKLQYLGKIGDLDSLFWYGYGPDHHVSRRAKRETTDNLMNDPRIEWVSEQTPLVRKKRDFPEDSHGNNAIWRKKRWSKKDINVFQDPMYNDQWYLTSNTGRSGMKIREAWEQGYSGQGVVVTILDDGVQRDHPDLADNYDKDASIDLNGYDADPTPTNDGWNQHGTRCASEVASLAGNSMCGVGIAFNSSIGGVRMLDGFVSDAVEAAGLGLNQNHIDIYSASWGPEDDGRTFDGPGPLAQAALKRGTSQGRNGLGNIFIWASGNGGQAGDSCSFDGYSTSIHTLSVGAVDYNNKKPWYLESCPSVIVSTYSSGSGNDPAVVAADAPRGCTKQHTGTSASAPIAAGIIALTLEANPKLNWRDVQHLSIRTAEQTPLQSSAVWITNGAGRKVSNEFGFGLMNAEAMVNAAKTWKTVPEQKSCKVVFAINPREQELINKFSRTFALDVDNECASVKYIEHVQVSVDMPYLFRRGALQLTMTSPSGTKSVLMPMRSKDAKSGGITDLTTNWPFMSVQQWGEKSKGRWVIQVENDPGNPLNRATLNQIVLTLYGTDSPAQPNDPTNDVATNNLFPSSTGR